MSTASPVSPSVSEQKAKAKNGHATFSDQIQNVVSHPAATSNIKHS